MAKLSLFQEFQVWFINWNWCNLPYDRIECGNLDKGKHLIKFNICSWLKKTFSKLEIEFSMVATFGNWGREMVRWGHEGTLYRVLAILLSWPFWLLYGHSLCDRLLSFILCFYVLLCTFLCVLYTLKKSKTSFNLRTSHC